MRKRDGPFSKSKFRVHDVEGIVEAPEYIGTHETSQNQTETKGSTKMEGTPAHVHIDNREDGTPMGYGYGGDCFGGGGLMGMILGAALFGGGFGGFGRGHYGCGDGAAKADAYGDRVRDTWNVDRDVLENKYACAIQDKDIENKINMAELHLEKQISDCCCATQLQGKDYQIEMLKMGNHIDKEFCATNAHIDKLECKVNQLPHIIKTAVTKSCLEQQLAGLTNLSGSQLAALGSTIASIPNGCYTC